MNNSKQTDLMAMDVTWSLEELELYDNRIGLGEATIFTISKTIVLAMGIIAQKTFYKMMKRLPGRVINQILYPHMVRAIHIIHTVACIIVRRVLISVHKWQFTGMADTHEYWSQHDAHLVHLPIFHGLNLIIFS